MLKYPTDLLKLIAHLQKLPGVGKKTAERFAFQLLEWGRQDLQLFGELLETLKQRVQACQECGCLMESVSCMFCQNSQRNPQIMCVAAHARDVYAIEGTGNFQGLYHVLGTLLSPLDGKTPESLNIPLLKKRIEQLGVNELILALDSTLEGDATTLFLKQQFPNIQVSRLALGLPIGSSLDFVDEGTLSQAITGRLKF